MLTVIFGVPTTVLLASVSRIRGPSGANVEILRRVMAAGVLAGVGEILAASGDGSLGHRWRSSSQLLYGRIPT